MINYGLEFRNNPNKNEDTHRLVKYLECTYTNLI